MTRKLMIKKCDFNLNSFKGNMMNSFTKTLMLIVAIVAISACPQVGKAQTKSSQYGGRYSYPSPNYNRSAYTTPMNGWKNYNAVKSGSLNRSHSYSGNAKRFSKSNYGQQPGTYHRNTQQGTAHSKGTLYNPRVYNGNRHPVNKNYNNWQNPPKTKAPSYKSRPSTPSSGRKTGRGRSA